MPPIITESESYYSNLEQMNISDLLSNINKEDKTIANAVEKALPQIEVMIAAILEKMKAGGRLFYIGSGTSGRLGIVDASECPPSFGVDEHLVIGLIAGGDKAIRKAIEYAEDSLDAGWDDLLKYNLKAKDFVIGISASGSTPYVVGAIQHCNKYNIRTGSITCNENTLLANESEFPVEIVVGPEFVTGSTRMKAGTAAKMALNMISTTLMIKLGKIKGNKMVDMQLLNTKLIKRGTRMIVDELNVSPEEAEAMLTKYGSVRKAIEANLKDEPDKT